MVLMVVSGLIFHKQGYYINYKEVVLNYNFFFCAALILPLLFILTIFFIPAYFIVYLCSFILVNLILFSLPFCFGYQVLWICVYIASIFMILAFGLRLLSFYYYKYLKNFFMWVFKRKEYHAFLIYIKKMIVINSLLLVIFFINFGVVMFGIRPFINHLLLG